MTLEDELIASAELLREFRQLPQLYRNRPVVIRFAHKRCFVACPTEECDALGLPPGNTLKGELMFEPKARALGGVLPAIVAGCWPLYAVGEIAQQLRQLPERQVVVADASTVFGLGCRVRRVEDERWRCSIPYEGILIVAFREQAEAEPDSVLPSDDS